MTTGKRQIPINHQGSRGARRDDPVAGRKDAPSAAAAKNPGTGRTDAAAASLQGSPNVHAASTAKTTAGSPRSRQDRAASPGANATELESLIAERDALVAEREALTTRLEALTSQVETLTDSRLRLQAGFENFRRRASREAVESLGARSAKF